MEAHAATEAADSGAGSDGFIGRELLDERFIRVDPALTATGDHRAQDISVGHGDRGPLTADRCSAHCSPLRRVVGCRRDHGLLVVRRYGPGLATGDRLQGHRSPAGGWSSWGTRTTGRGMALRP
ncbi:hypothetical protein ADK38_14385, partial [Streptomyces varsoviensis]